MSLNTINLIINTMNFVTAASGVQTNMEGQQGLNQNMQAGNTGGNFNSQLNTTLNPQSSFLSQSQIQNQKPLSIANQLVISTVEVEQRSNYIKDLLNLPRDFQTFIEQIQGQNANSEAIKQLSKLLIGEKINIKALNTLLTNNSKEAVQKLMMTIMAVSKMGSNNVGQLKELMGMLAAANPNADNIQTVKSFLMLYLPWLPLSVRNELNLDFEIGITDKKGGEAGEEGLETITIMIQTANFGNVLVTLTLNQNSEINISIIADENFPEKEVLKKLNEENKKTNLQTNVSIQKQKTPVYKNEKTQEIEVTNCESVSPKLILAAHSLIKIIIDVDSNDFIINEEEEN